LKGQYVRGDHDKPTVILEAIASRNLWIWHAFFGVAGSNNDINVLNQSDVFNDVLQGRAPEVRYSINRTEYNMGYYLSDGIYPEWATFVKSISMPQGEKIKLFAQHQEGARKDIERAFGVLQSRFAIIRNPTRSWHLDSLKCIMDVCIILHNMIVEDERATYGAILIILMIILAMTRLHHQTILILIFASSYVEDTMFKIRKFIDTFNKT